MWYDHDQYFRPFLDFVNSHKELGEYGVRLTGDWPQTYQRELFKFWLSKRENCRMWRTLKPKNNLKNYTSEKMIQAIKKAEELKKEKAMKELEQADSRRRRAESRMPQAQPEQAGVEENRLVRTNPGGDEEMKVAEREEKEDRDKLEEPEVESSGTETSPRSSSNEEEGLDQIGGGETKEKKKKLKKRRKGKKTGSQGLFEENEGHWGVEKRRLYNSLVEKDQSKRVHISSEISRWKRKPERVLQLPRRSSLSLPKGNSFPLVIRPSSRITVEAPGRLVRYLQDDDIPEGPTNPASSRNTVEAKLRK
ncbi:hypothetical protein DFH28DRAFT_939052 [Melampsora americana]|nr:hypothetical protein DFH28DRAFT_939052 [Melampsora americana]